MNSPRKKFEKEYTQLSNTVAAEFVNSMGYLCLEMPRIYIMIPNNNDQKLATCYKFYSYRWKP